MFNIINNELAKHSEKLANLYQIVALNKIDAIDEETLGIPVIAIGVPTVVDAATIVADALEKMHKELQETAFLQARDSVALSSLYNMYVTAKDIDSTIKRVSFTLAEALNMTFEKEFEE